MRKLFSVLLFGLIGVLCISAAHADFLLPASLIEIGEEAFSGTAAETVIIQDALVEIGDYSFSDMPALSDIWLPQSVTSIGNHTFEGSESVTIHGIFGSYVDFWAHEHGVLFTAVILTKDGVDLRVVVFILLCLLFSSQPAAWKPDALQISILYGKIRIQRHSAEIYPLLDDFP